MKKLFAIAIAASMLSGLYGLSLGLGASYESVEDSTRYLCIKGDARIAILPVLDVRGELLLVPLGENAKAINFGTFAGSDLLIKFPMPAAFQPYLVLGVWFNMSLEDDDSMYLGLKAGLGAEYGFGGFNAYLEGGLNRFTYTKVGDLDSETANPIYVQVGLTFPIEL